MQALAWADGTRKSLNSQQRTFLDFLRIYGYNDFPVSGDTLVVFTMYLIMSGRLSNSRSIRQYLSAASTLHKMYGKVCDTPSTYGPLHNTVRGIDRAFSAPVKHRLPVDSHILFNLVSDLDHNITTASWADKSFFLAVRALYIILYFSMLRAGNTMPITEDDFDPLRHLSWGRVSWEGEGVILSIPLSKTIQNMERVHQIPLVPCSEPTVCPLQALQDLVDARGPQCCSPDNPVFARWKNGGWAPLTKPPVDRLFRSQISRMGLDPALYSLHSLRHGGLQDGLAADIPISYLRNLSENCDCARPQEENVCLVILSGRSKYISCQKSVDYN